MGRGVDGWTLLKPAKPKMEKPKALPVEERRSLGWPKLSDVACRCVYPCHHKLEPPRPEPQPIPCRCAFWCHHKEEKAAAQRKARQRVDLGRYVINGRTDRFSSRLLGMRCEAWKTYNPENKR